MPAPTQRPRRARTLTTLTLIGLLAGATWATLPSGHVTIEPGPAPTTQELLGQEPPNGRGSVHVTTIAATPANNLDRLRCLTGSDCTLLPHNDTTSAQAAMDTALGDAQHLGDNLTEKFTNPRPPRTWETQLPVGGPSAGLALTLHRINERLPGDITGGKQIAATGSIDHTGDVGQVGGVEHKAAGAHAAGITTMLVPDGEGDAARAGAPKMHVVEVATVGEAITWLCARGATSTICP